MNTNNLVLKEVDQYMADYAPAYTALMPAFMRTSQSYAAEVGKINFKRVSVIGDIRSKVIDPKDTAIKLLKVGQDRKSFNKYFLGSKFTSSELQSSDEIEEAIKMFLDEHNKQSDEIFLTGDGTNDSNTLNNGLLYSQDKNYFKRGSAEVEKDANDSHLADLYDKITDAIDEADDLDGQKLVLFYGDRPIKEHKGLFVETKTSLIETLVGANAGVSFGKIPKEITPSGEAGILVCNLDQLKLNYTVLAQLRDRDVNKEDMYFWANFIMGSSMLEVKNKKGIVRQPLTFEA